MPIPVLKGSKFPLQEKSNKKGEWEDVNCLRMFAEKKAMLLHYSSGFQRPIFGRFKL